METLAGSDSPHPILKGNGERPGRMRIKSSGIHFGRVSRPEKKRPIEPSPGVIRAGELSGSECQWSAGSKSFVKKNDFPSKAFKVCTMCGEEWADGMHSLLIPPSR